MHLPDTDSVASPPCLSHRAAWAGSGSIINTLMARTLAQPELISLAAGFVDQQTLPAKPTRQAFAAIAADDGRMRAALQYGTTIGFRPLCEAVLERLLAADGHTGAPPDGLRDRVVLTAGSNELLYLVSDILFNPGDIVLCSAPSYFVYLGTLGNLGVRAVGVASDAEGIIPDAIEEELVRRRKLGELDRVKAVYVTTYYDNPCGASLPASRRAALVEIVRHCASQQRIYVIEDAAYRELRYFDDDIPSLWSFDEGGETVIHAGTFSKSFSPGIRIGWGVLPSELVQPLLAEKGHIDFGSPNFNQHLMHEIVRSGQFDEHVVMLRERYREKLEATLAAAAEHLGTIPGVRFERPSGGLYLWVELPEGMDAGLDGPLFDRAVAEGVFYIPGEPCFPGEGVPRRNNVLRLSFGVPSCETIVRGIAALGRAIRKTRR